ncbi:MAG: hypothetical protein D6773_06095 [Alphaproteobacteria bacterium]|nr:MAG: hypothetical protein D6773_06095 [Alphaproteobacteria bacterium]
MLLSSCGNNLDKQCASLFEDLTKEFDEILEYDSAEQIAARLKNLPQEKRILKLRARAQKRVSDKISSGEIWSELNPDAGPRPTSHRIVIEGVDRRKMRAMNAFNQRWFKVSADGKEQAGWLGMGGDSPLGAILDLRSACNQTLR